MKLAHPNTRRDFLRLAGAGAGALALIQVIPRPANAEAIVFPKKLLPILQEDLGGTDLNAGRISLEMPFIAETGLSVPITFKIDSPMTDDDHVTRIMGFAPGNPEPILADYLLGPRAGLAEVSSRIRLARTQTVFAAARMSDGTRWGTSFDIEVTLGACVEIIFDADRQIYNERHMLRFGTPAPKVPGAH
ncbi:MAG: twin-arginine translocation signal domain-containing protein [Proteobacteria bacterium]|nr:twin-arginine translocation signal domain-containing protein [Pseudomonadota bacterium]MDA1132014.1 twin-arginine translocation signal domain-containing protein [Pseudomonadota bacterium]